MVSVGKVLNSLIKKTRRFIKVREYGDRIGYNVSDFGSDFSPPKGMNAIYVKSDNSNETFIIGYLNKDFDVEVGEKRIYSTDKEGKNVSSFIKLKNDKTIEINGGSDNIVSYNELKNEFNILKSEYENLASKWNQFCISYMPGSPSSIGTPPNLSSSTVHSTSQADISKVQVGSIKIGY